MTEKKKVTDKNNPQKPKKERPKNYKERLIVDMDFEDLVKLSVSNINIIDVNSIELNKDKTEKK